ncbi:MULTISPECIES: DUF4434 domain-containing protein [Arthrobacter]|uniref:DUF4434 domain-containing protein n=2 Tax=Arthrobacter TaxID=1663 RepID=A0ABU9KNS3_9MICC|nr:DUF4434 domain-containing protein [Arthrobacter sp. YJM1]MDP5228576.1 hypothetical protein [Arthrobacter sp. YJM1]
MRGKTKLLIAAGSALLVTAFIIGAFLVRLGGSQSVARPVPGGPSSSAASEAPWTGPAQAVTDASPISGYFYTPTDDPGRNGQALQGMKSLGADTVVTFGHPVRPAEDLSRNDREHLFAACLVDRQPCLSASFPGISIQRTLTYTDGTDWSGPATSGGLRACTLDRDVLSGGKSYTLLFLPAGGAGCDDPATGYDLVVVANSAPTGRKDGQDFLDQANAHGMKVFAGLPQPVGDPKHPWLPDVSYKPAFGQFLTRYLHAQQQRRPSALAGYYQSFETSISARPDLAPVLELYSLVNAAVDHASPGATVLVSPYLDSRLTIPHHDTPDGVRAGVRRLADTAQGVALKMAPQDGFGTGKMGAYEVTEASQELEKYAAAAHGEIAWDAEYPAPLSAFHRAITEGLRGTGVEQWANIEAMTPTVTPDNRCAGDALRGRTTLDRLARQLQQLNPAVRKVISYRWSPNFTCTPGGTSLAQELVADRGRPLILGWQSTGTGLAVYGYNLRGGRLTVSLTADGGHSSGASALFSGWDGGYGRSAGTEPRLERAVVQDLGLPQGYASGILTLTVTAPDGRRNRAPYASTAWE